LDNFEQVVSAAAHVADILAACPNLKVMVTSRMTLHIQGEHEFAVPPLVVPDPTHLPDLIALSQYEAVALFIQRAQAVKPEFQVTNANAPAVAEICVRLDGLPLAIELAAARIKLLPPQALLARLGQRLAVLTSGPHDAPARQQTLRNTLAWSYNLLDAQEQRLFRRLAVFVGGCTLEAIEAVCIALETSTPPMSTLDSVASLIDKSLLQQTEQEGEQPRLVMLETIREYGLECLRESGEDLIIQQAHAHYYLSLAEEAEPHFKGSQQIMWWDRLEDEQDNIRTALSWLIAHQEGESALHFCGELYWFWYIRGYWSEGRQWIARVLELLQTSQRTGAHAKVLCAAALLVLDDGASGNETSVRFLEESIGIYRETGDKRGLALSLSWLGFLLPSQDIGAGRALLEESITLCQEEGERWTLALSLEHLGWSYLHQRNFSRAAALWEKSIALYRELGDRKGIAETLDGLAALAASQGNIKQAETLWKEQLLLSRTLNEKRTTSDALNELGRLAAAQDDLPQAEALCRESFTLAQDIGYNYGIGAAMSSLGQFARRRGDNAQTAIWAEKNLARNRGPFELFDAGQSALDQGDLTQATSLFQEGLSLGQESRDEPTIAHFFHGFALLALEKKQPWKAACLLGAAEQLLPVEADSFGQTEFERIVKDVRTQLGEEAFATAWAEGRSMTLEQALDAPEPTSASPAKVRITYPYGLTPRELEVLRLLATGLTDAQIAEQLVLSLHTIHAHLRTIYSKLGVTSRSAATRYAFEHQLV
jgi:predicted ATPase/DNA-binding CsgD family transcriptional regulator